MHRKDADFSKLSVKMNEKKSTVFIHESLSMEIKQIAQHDYEIK